MFGPLSPGAKFPQSLLIWMSSQHQVRWGPCTEDRNDPLLRVTAQSDFWNGAEHEYFDLLNPYSQDTLHFKVYFRAVETGAQEVKIIASGLYRHFLSWVCGEVEACCGPSPKYARGCWEQKDEGAWKCELKKE